MTGRGRSRGIKKSDPTTQGQPRTGGGRGNVQQTPSVADPAPGASAFGMPSSTPATASAPSAGRGIESQPTTQEQFETEQQPQQKQVSPRGGNFCILLRCNLNYNLSILS